MRAVCLAAALACACSPSQAPKARTAGKVLSLTGVGALIVSAFTVHYLGDHAREIVMGFSAMSAIGVGTYAAGELSQPPNDSGETTIQRHERWARELTDRAYNYARDGRCWRVRNIDPRVRAYDREHHKNVFMRDPEIVKCLTTVPVAKEPDEPRSETGSEPESAPIERDP